MRGASLVLVVLAVGVAAVGALAVLGWPAAEYRDRDFMGFWSGGRALLEGRDPYDPIYWQELHDRFGSAGGELVPPGTGFGYPMTTALLTFPFGTLPIAIAAPAWLVAQSLAGAAGLIALARRLFPDTFRRDAPVLLAFGLSSQPGWLLAEGGNVGGFLLAITSGALVLLLGGRAFAAGSLLGLLVLKPHPFLWFVPALVLAAPARLRLRLVAGGVVVSFLITAASFLVRPDWASGWLVSVSRIQSVPVGRATIWGVFPSDARWLGAILLAALLGGFLWWWLRRPGLAFVAGGALGLSLAAAPYGWSYDHLVLLVPIAAGMAAVASAAPRERLGALALLALLAVPLPWLLYMLAFTRGQESFSVFVPLSVLIALVILERRAARRSSSPRRTAPAGRAAPSPGRG